MQKKIKKPKRPTKSPRLQSTKKLSAFTPTFKQQSSSQRKTFDALVEGVSMWPLLREGDRVFFKKENPENLTLGDVVVIDGFNREGEAIWVVHRIMGRVGPLFLEAGDNGLSASLVTKEKIAGRVFAVKTAKGKMKKLPPFTAKEVPFHLRPYLVAARVFLMMHLTKDRVLGRRKSKVLWQMSEAYRKCFHFAGLQVPVLFPSESK